MAGSGKVVYWESISSAATFAFIKKDRSGVEYTISGMTSGEKVVDITNAEPAGFILSFNTGRLAYLNVRDNHGRPAVSVQFIRSGLSGSSSGFLGSIRHAFSHLSLRGDIAAVRADRSARVGEKSVVALSSKGRLQAWNIHRGGHSEHLGESDMRDEIALALREADPISQDFPPESLEAIDFTFVPKGLETKYLELSRLSNAMESEDASVQHLLLLVCLTKSRTSRYALVEVILTSTECRTGMVRPITSYSSPVEQSDVAQTVRPRVYLPRPALVAFIVFDRAAVIASVAIPPESPDSQLQSDNHMVPPSFEDVVDFREDKVHEILGSGFEETPTATGHEETRNQRYKNKNPSTVLFVRGAGIIRLLTNDVDKFASDKPPVVTAKSKLEQAVFFGAKQDNPLVFDSRKEIQFASEELGRAALEISHEILSSSTTYISTLPAHLEENLQARSYALERLTNYLQSTGADLDRKTRWTLLFNAEKMHVAALLWKRHEAFTASRSPDDKKSLVGSIVEFIHDDQKHKPRAKIGEVDAVRHWFINDVYRLEIFVAWAYEVIKLLYKDHLLDDCKVTVMMHEAMQINMCSHTAAMDFRKANLSRYGLGDEELRNGILVSGYGDLPEPWTATEYGANNQRRLLDLASSWINEKWLAEKKPPPTAKSADPKILDKIYNDLPTLTDAVLTSLLEQARYAKAASNGRMAQEFANDYRSDRIERPRFLAQIGHWEQAARMARKHGSLDALAAILLDHVEKLEGEIAEQGLSPLEQQSLRAQRESKKSELQSNLSDFGADFAFPLYDFLLEKHGVGAVLDYDLDLVGYKTKYLRSKPELAKISWINDVQTEGDVHQAADTLVNLALTKEQQVWNKKIELSLGKLALLAEAEATNGFDSLQIRIDTARREETISQVERALVAIRIQDEIYSHVVPSTYEAVDEAAALNFAMETYSTNIPRRQKALHQIFEDGMGRLLRREALDAMSLIDLLTLMSGSSDALSAHPFCHALKVASVCCHSDEVNDAKALIWRRLFIRDDWPKLNDTQLQDDTEVSSRLGGTELYATLVDCIRARKFLAFSVHRRGVLISNFFFCRGSARPFQAHATPSCAGCVFGSSGPSLPQLRCGLSGQAEGRHEVGG